MILSLAEAAAARLAVNWAYLAERSILRVDGGTGRVSESARSAIVACVAMCPPVAPVGTHFDALDERSTAGTREVLRASVAAFLASPEILDEFLARLRASGADEIRALTGG